MIGSNNNRYTICLNTLTFSPMYTVISEYLPGISSISGFFANGVRVLIHHDARSLEKLNLDFSSRSWVDLMAQ